MISRAHGGCGHTYAIVFGHPHAATRAVTEGGWGGQRRWKGGRWGERAKSQDSGAIPALMLGTRPPLKMRGACFRCLPNFWIAMLRGCAPQATVQ